MARSKSVSRAVIFALGCLFAPTVVWGFLPAQESSQPKKVNPSADLDSLLKAGQLHYKNGDAKKALEYFNQALPLQQAMGDRAGQAATLDSIGSAYYDLGEKHKALEYFNQALPLRQAAGDRAGEASTLDSIGTVYSDLGEKQKGLEYLNKALPLRQAVADRAGEANTLNNLGTVYADLGEARKALEYFNKALPLIRALGDRASEAALLDNIGSIYSDLGEKQTSLKYREMALPLRQAAGDRAGEATTLSNIGVLYSSLGEEQKALEYFNKALPLKQATGDRAGEATTLDNMGTVYSHLGEKQRALEYYNKALPLRQATGDSSGEATTLDNIGVVYFALGEKQKAVEYFNKALPLRQAAQDRSGEAVSLNNIGSVYHDLGERQKALEYYEKALPLTQATGDRSGEAVELHNIGSIHADLGENRKALRYYDKALTLRQALGDRSGQAATLHNIGVSYFDLGKEQKAVVYYNRSLPLSRAVGNRFLEARTLVNIEHALSSSRPDTAIVFGKEAVNVLQSVRRDNQGLSDSLRSSYEKSIEDYYRSLANLLIQRERFGEAEEVLGLLKDKEASESVHRDSVSDQLHSATLLDSEKKALARYDQIVDQVGVFGQKKAVLAAKADKEPLTTAELTEEKQLDKDLEATNIVLQKFLEEEERSLAPASGPAMKADQLLQANMSASVQDALKALGPDVVAIYTLVTPDRYVALLVSPEANKAYTVPIKEVELNKKIFAFRQQLQDPGSDPRPLAQELYKIVFPEGLRHDLDAMNAKTIMWSVDSTLRYIPFAALYDGRDYLVKDYRQSLITPESMPYLTKEPTRQWRGIGFGVSDGSSGTKPLPSVPIELHGIFRETVDGKSPIPGTVLLNAAFTHQSFEDDLRQKRNPLVHIATHFASRPGYAANSQLLLGDGMMSLAEIEAKKHLFEGVDLLTLSACNTAFTNRSEDGHEVDSFGTIAHLLGAKAVIASLWSVDDESTAHLMQTMYRLRQQTQGMTKDEALRQAQLALSTGQLKSNAATDWTHPYYWAPFILIGNWK